MATGGICAGLNLIGAIVLTEYAELNYLVALGICSVLGILVGFVLNRSWTFRKHGKSAGAEFLRYVLVAAVNVPIGLASCAFLVNYVNIPYAYAIAILAVVYSPLLYTVHRAWTFGLSWARSQ